MKLVNIKIHTCDKLVQLLPSESVKCSCSDLISFSFFFIDCIRNTCRDETSHCVVFLLLLFMPESLIIKTFFYLSIQRAPSVWNGSGHRWTGNGDDPQTDEPLSSLHDSTDPVQFARFGASGPRHYDQQQQHAFLSSGPSRPSGAGSHGGPHAGLPLRLPPSTP